MVCVYSGMYCFSACVCYLTWLLSFYFEFAGFIDSTLDKFGCVVVVVQFDLEF